MDDLQKPYAGPRQFTHTESTIATIHLVEGPVGSGKSTFCGQLSLSLNAPHLDLDEWMVTLFSADRPDDQFMHWYAERKQRCIAQIWLVTCEMLNSGSDVVLELGLVQIADREDFYRRVDATDFELKVYVLDAALEERRRRVVQRNRQQSSTYKMAVSDEIFELANSAWQTPTVAEIERHSIQFVS